MLENVIANDAAFLTQVLHGSMGRFLLFFLTAARPATSPAASDKILYKVTISDRCFADQGLECRRYGSQF